MLQSQQQKNTDGTPKSYFHALRFEMYVAQLIPTASFRAELQPCRFVTTHLNAIAIGVFRGG